MATGIRRPASGIIHFWLRFYRHEMLNIIKLSEQERLPVNYGHAKHVPCKRRQTILIQSFAIYPFSLCDLCG